LQAVPAGTAIVDSIHLSSLVADATAHFEAGRLQEAAASYREIVSMQPGQVEALRALSYLALKAGDAAGAREHARLAVQAAPEDARLWHGLGRLCRECKDEAGAIEAYERAVRLQPDLLDAWISLGVACRAADPQRALRCYERVLELEPDNQGALVNVSNVLLDLGHRERAEERLRAGLERLPRSGVVLMQLGKMLGVQRRVEEAAALFRRAMEIEAVATEAAVSLAMLERAVGRHHEAVASLREVVRREPGKAEGHRTLGELLAEIGEYGAAVAALRRSVQIDPGVKEVHFRLSVILRMGGALSAAREAAQCALALDPAFLPARCALADIAAAEGDTDTGARIYDELIALPELTLAALGNFLLLSNRLPELDPAALAQRHRRWVAERYAMHPVGDWFTSPEPSRRLRIGYVSGDLRRHSVAYFLEPVLACHDRDRFEIVAYSTNADADEHTARLRSYFDQWVVCAGMPDETIAQRIRDDRIDLLVDLAGHSGWNGLRVFARKPAPVQITWLGYPTTTGLPAMDYRITDPVVDPEGFEHYSTERLVRLPASYYCYRPFAGAPDAEPAPRGAAEQFTFGSFNDAAKFTPATLDLWAAVLAAVPHSRLLLKASALLDPGVRGRLLAAFSRRGVAGSRIELKQWQAGIATHLDGYRRMDVALDTIPYNGGTTTCEALWMGVPVITLRGSTHAGRMGASLLSAAGLPDLIAADADAFVGLAVALADNPARVEGSRHTLRERLRASPLMDEIGFTRALESEYRRVWIDWCAGADRSRAPTLARAEP